MNITATASLSSISATASIGHTVSGGDTTPPVFSAGPSSVNVDETSFQITATLDEWGTVYSLVQLAASAAPSIATVISTGESAIDTGSGVTINHTGLDDNTAYTAYLVAVDDDDNTQAALSEVDVTTDNAVDPPVLSSVVISDETPTTIDVDGSVDLDGSTVFAYILDRGVAAPNAATIEANADDSVVSAGGVFAFDDLATALSIDPDGLATLHLVAKKDGVYSNVVSTDVDYFTLESLGLTLDLRAPIVATDPGLSDKITLGTPPDVNAILDLSGGGHNFVQATDANKPHFVDSDFTLYGDGSDDKMTINDISAWKTLVSGDTAGMFSMMFYDIAGAGVETRLEGFGRSSGVGYFQIMRILNTNVLQVTISNGAAVNTLTYDVTALRGGWIDVFVGSDGSNYHLWVNGSLVAHTEVLNFADGSWINSFAAATWNGFYLFQNRVGTSFPIKLRALNYISGRIYTPEEIALIRATPLYAAT